MSADYVIAIAKVDAVLDSMSDDDDPAGALANLIDEENGGLWTRSDDLDDKYAVIESSGAIWYVHEDANGIADCRRCATWAEARGFVPMDVSQ